MACATTTTHTYTEGCRRFPELQTGLGYGGTPCRKGKEGKEKRRRRELSPLRGLSWSSRKQWAWITFKSFWVWAKGWVFVHPCSLAFGYRPRGEKRVTADKLRSSLEWLTVEGCLLAGSLPNSGGQGFSFWKENYSNYRKCLFMTHCSFRHLCKYLFKSYHSMDRCLLLLFLAIPYIIWIWMLYQVYEYLYSPVLLNG